MYSAFPRDTTHDINRNNRRFLPARRTWRIALLRVNSAPALI